MPPTPLRATVQLLAIATLACGLDAQAASGALRLAPCQLSLQAHWEALVDTTYGFERKHALVRDLAPATKEASYDAAAFQPFLPPDEVAVGATWRIDAAAALPFLRQLHRGATIVLHHDHGSGISAPGAWGCLRALSPEHAEIALRVHADFLLAGDGTRGPSSWFTPAQFRGRMAIDRRTGHVVAFQLRVPPSRANVDVNIGMGQGVVADIGSVPRLELFGGAFPELAPATPQIAEPEADRILERAFYPFAAIGWLDLSTARKTSLATGKPLHVVALFGSLADESC